MIEEIGGRGGRQREGKVSKGGEREREGEGQEGIINREKTQSKAHSYRCTVTV